MFSKLKEILTGTHLPESNAAVYYPAQTFSGSLGSLGGIGNQYNSLCQMAVQRAQAVLAQNQQNQFNQNLWVRGLQQGIFGTPVKPKFDPAWRALYEQELQILQSRRWVVGL